MSAPDLSKLPADASGKKPSLPDVTGMSEEQKKETYMEWLKRHYNDQYESWMPWIEDMYLKYFTKDNKASYATKGPGFVNFCSELRLTCARHTQQI